MKVKLVSIYGEGEPRTSKGMRVAPKRRVKAPRRAAQLVTHHCQYSDEQPGNKQTDSAQRRLLAWLPAPLVVGRVLD